MLVKVKQSKRINDSLYKSRFGLSLISHRRNRSLTHPTVRSVGLTLHYGSSLLSLWLKVPPQSFIYQFFQGEKTTCRASRKSSATTTQDFVCLATLGHPSSQDPERLLDVLDAIASICVVDREIYFVSLAMDPNHATLYVSTNGEVPITVIAHLIDIRRRLKELKAVLEPGPLTNSNTDPNVTQARTDSELKLQLQQMMHQHSCPKLRRRFQKRGPAILQNTKSSSHSCRLATPTIAKLSR